VQAKLFAPALLALFAYMFGYPAYVGLYLWRNRSLVMEDQLLRARGTGSDALTNPNAFDLRRTMGRSYYQFKPEFFLWLLAILARKLAIAATAVIFNKNPSFQMAACLLIMFLAYAAHVQVRPYMSPSECEGVLKRAAAAATTVCRASSGVCDAQESCTGASFVCPTDGAASDGTLCSDGNACTTIDGCQAGVCTGAMPVVCSPVGACRASAGRPRRCAMSQRMQELMTHVQLRYYRSVPVEANSLGTQRLTTGAGVFSGARSPHPVRPTA
jgi:hypothetical protein